VSLSLSSEPSREDLKRAFLRANGFADLRRERLPGDASTRSYERLHAPDGSTLILMDQPPQNETAPCPPDATPEERLALGYNASARLAAGRTDAFAATAGYLTGRGLSAPTVRALDPEDGFAMLEDLGDELFARRVERGEPEAELYEAAVDALVRLHAEPPPAELEGYGVRWPLLSYDDLALRTGCDLFLTWWPAYRGLDPFPAEALAEWEAAWAPVRARGEAGATVFAHRDYHAENLVWRPEREGPARVGMLDFQDALRAHPAWDLLSLLQDARRDVAPELEAAMLERYLAARPEVEREAFLADYRALAGLNNTRILFIFARQIAHFGRPRYVEFMPRTWGHLHRNLADPALSAVRAWFDRWLAPDLRTPR
jgi:N-acetylmuramate 1-kinase